jgi:hypothetical protein
VNFSVKNFVCLTFPLAIVFSGQAVRADDGTARITVRGTNFLETPPSPVEQNEVSFTTEYDRRFELNRKVSFQFHPYLYGTTLQDRRQQSLVLDPRAFYLAVEPKFAWLRVGYMTMKWEGTDGLNPMDIASMKDWSDPLSTETRASGAVAIGKSGDKYDFEAAYIPYQTLWLLPGVKSPWLPRRFSFPLRTDQLEVRLPDRVEYRFTEPIEFNDARRNNVASRLQLRTEVADVSLGYYEGLADSPALYPVLDVTVIKAPPQPIYQLLSPANLTPVAYRVRTASGYLSHAFGQWIFRASSRYDQPLGTDTKIPGWSQYSVFGFERSFDLGPNTWTAILQGAWVRAPESASLLSVKDVFNETVLFGLRAPIGDDWTTMISGFKATKDSSYYGKFEAGRRMNEHWRVDGSLELLDGPATTLLGVFGANDRAMLSMSGVY